MARGRVWQGLVEWWKSTGAAATSADERVTGEPGERRDAEPAVDVAERWVHRELVSQDAAPPTADDEVSDEELHEFLAADHDPVEADPAFKRKLREQLWAMISDNDPTRQ